ncbi:NAD-dependent protein deacetylase [Nakamurella flavida]|uniref:NAD-dependent protein deacetylase n=1 Tax=Nakamurella flavida TaxID=363630 RepID=UPI00351FBE87
MVETTVDGTRASATERDADDLARAVRLLTGRPIVALTGAGMSTDSGIPDYRGPGAPPRRPMTYQEFCSGPVARQRYWARSHLGWRRLAHSAPNDGHRALAGLEARGRLLFLITQNVDGLHAEAGTRAQVELHGRIDEVICLQCRTVSSRAELHERLESVNPLVDAAAQDHLATAPDGDVELEDTSGFHLVDCLVCGGVLKPHVVFFGENVPRDRVARCYAAVDAAGALLVAGSSLTVMSGYRFVRHAAARGIPVVIVNRGTTRGDPQATVKIDAGCSDTLSQLFDSL